MIDAGDQRRRYERLLGAVEALERGEPSPAGGSLRQEIMELYGEVDELAARVAELRANVGLLGERYWRVIAPVATGEGGSDAPPPAASGRQGRSVRADELDLSTYLDRAWNRLVTCRYEEALAEADRALERVPTSEQAGTLRGWALMRLGRFTEARSTLEGVLQGQGAGALARASLGYVALSEGSEDEAAEQLLRVIREGVDRKAVLYSHLYLGMLCTERMVYAEGREHLQRALELGPLLVEAYWEMGRSYYLEGDATRALDAWRRGVEVNRFDPWGERCQEAVDQMATEGAVRMG